MLTGDEPEDAEQAILRALNTGELVDLQGGAPSLNERDQEQTRDAARVVRADLLVDLLTSRNLAAGSRPRAVKLRGAHISGSLDLEAATLTCPLLLQDCRLGEPVNLNDATAPSIRLPGCHIPGMTAEQLSVRGNLELNRGFTSHSQVSLEGARIGGALSFGGARLTNPDGYALLAIRLTVDQTMFCWNGFIAHGGVCLLNAHIGGSLLLDGAHLINPGGYALAAGGLIVERELSCRQGFTAHGEVNLFGAYIGARLNLRGAALTNPDGLTLDLERLRTPALYLLPRERPDGVVDLVNAQVGNFYDDPATWPATLRLRGFVYDSLENEAVAVGARLRWLARGQDGYLPQLYEQLAAAYRRAGREEAVKRVRIAKQWRRRQELNPLGRLWNWLLYATVGYGYRPWLAGVWLAALLAVGTAVFNGTYPEQMTPTSSSPPRFYAAAYTLDLLLPIVDLGQQQAWLPEGAALAWSWALTGAGWVLTTAVAAGLTGVLKRD
jgi:hypothetical protein